jgi:hypothetical protein
VVKRRASIEIYEQLALQVPEEGARAYETVVKRHVGDVRKLQLRCRVYVRGTGAVEG